MDEKAAHWTNKDGGSPEPLIALNLNETNGEEQSSTLSAHSLSLTTYHEQKEQERQETAIRAADAASSASSTNHTGESPHSILYLLQSPSDQQSQSNDELEVFSFVPRNLTEEFTSTSHLPSFVASSSYTFSTSSPSSSQQDTATTQPQYVMPQEESKPQMRVEGVQQEREATGEERAQDHGKERFDAEDRMVIDQVAATANAGSAGTECGQLQASTSAVPSLLESPASPSSSAQSTEVATNIEEPPADVGGAVSQEVNTEGEVTTEQHATTAPAGGEAESTTPAGANASEQEGGLQEEETMVTEARESEPREDEEGQNILEADSLDVATPAASTEASADTPVAEAIVTQQQQKQQQQQQQEAGKLEEPTSPSHAPSSSPPSQLQPEATQEGPIQAPPAASSPAPYASSTSTSTSTAAESAAIPVGPTPEAPQEQAPPSTSSLVTVKVEQTDDSNAAAIAPSSSSSSSSSSTSTDGAPSSPATASSASSSTNKPPRGSEVFVGGLGKDVNEADLYSAFANVGEIFEIRLMKDANTGESKGYAFVRFTTPKFARLAVQQVDGAMLKGRKIGVVHSNDNQTLFLGHLDKDWKQDDLEHHLREAKIKGVTTITLMKDTVNVARNRGFAFVEFSTHEEAAKAHAKIMKPGFRLGEVDVKVDWAEPLNEPSEEVMAKVKSIYICNLPLNVDDDLIRSLFAEFGEIERIVLSKNLKSARRDDFAFVNYTERSAALSAIDARHGYKIDDDHVLDVTLAKPVSEQERQRESGRRDDHHQQHGGRLGGSGGGGMMGRGGHRGAGFGGRGGGGGDFHGGMHISGGHRGGYRDRGVGGRPGDDYGAPRGPGGGDRRPFSQRGGRGARDHWEGGPQAAYPPPAPHGSPFGGGGGDGRDFRTGGGHRGGGRFGGDSRLPVGGGRRYDRQPDHYGGRYDEMGMGGPGFEAPHVPQPYIPVGGARGGYVGHRGGYRGGGAVGAPPLLPPQPYSTVPHDYDSSGGRKRRFGEVDAHGRGGRGGGGFSRATRHKPDEGQWHPAMEAAQPAQLPVPHQQPMQQGAWGMPAQQLQHQQLQQHQHQHMGMQGQQQQQSYGMQPQSYAVQPQPQQQQQPLYRPQPPTAPGGWQQASSPYVQAQPPPQVSTYPGYAQPTAYQTAAQQPYGAMTGYAQPQQTAYGAYIAAPQPQQSAYGTTAAQQQQAAYAAYASGQPYAGQATTAAQQSYATVAYPGPSGGYYGTHTATVVTAPPPPTQGQQQQQQATQPQ